MIVSCWQQNKQGQDLILERLKKHLKLAGITIAFKSIKQYEGLAHKLDNSPTHTVFLVTGMQLNALFPLREGEPKATLSSVFELVQNIKNDLFQLLLPFCY